MRITAHHFVCGDVLIGYVGYVMPRAAYLLIRPTNTTQYANDPYIFTFIAHPQCTRIEGLHGWHYASLFEGYFTTLFYSNDPDLGYELISRVNV